MGACSGMVGFLCFLGLIGPPLWLLMLLRVLATWLRSRSGVILLTCFLDGVSDGYDAVEVVSSPDHPSVWTDGSLVLDRVSGVSASGVGVLCSPVREQLDWLSVWSC